MSLKEKVCKSSTCENTYVPRNMQHRTCSWQCAINYQREVVARRKVKENRKALKEFRDGDIPHLKKVAQQEVNKYVRLRDINECCLSCEAPPGYRQEAGHYKSSGGHASIRFHTLNIWSQCHKCNCHLSANLVPYRANLIKKIGLEKVEWLESQNQPRKYTVEYLTKLIRVFRRKIKQIEKRL